MDLEAVTFIDVTALRTVFEVAGELPAGSVLVLRRRPDRMARLLELVGWRHCGVEVQAR